jgi:hypothetical protein
MRNFIKNILNKILGYLISFRDKYLTEDTISEGLELDEIRDAFEDYIGLIIVNFETYDDDISDIENQIAGKMVTRITSDRKNIHIGLSSLTGNSGGQISLKPTITGQFAERMDDGMMPIWSAKYKITFVGGACIEYIDTHDTGSVSFAE